LQADASLKTYHRQVNQRFPMDARTPAQGLSPNAAAARQLLWLGLVAVAGFALLLFVLGSVAARTGGGATAARAVDVAEQSISLAYQFEPPQLDSTRATDTASSYVLGHVMEGLLREDEHGAIIGGVAERWDIRPD
jgi:ABC-type oligopeptide transport system substrate-binding subunit